MSLVDNCSAVAREVLQTPAVRSFALQGRISCASAFALMERHQLTI
jgi:hypothetical protein